MLRRLIANGLHLACSCAHCRQKRLSITLRSVVLAWCGWCAIFCRSPMWKSGTRAITNECDTHTHTPKPEWPIRKSYFHVIGHKRLGIENEYKKDERNKRDSTDRVAHTVSRYDGNGQSKKKRRRKSLDIDVITKRMHQSAVKFEWSGMEQQSK